MHIQHALPEDTAAMEAAETERTKPAAPAWKVYFTGSFWGHSGRDHAGSEIRLNKQFEWAGHHWLIPAAYSCGRGLVLDLCMRAPAGDIRRFMKKWKLNPENDSCLHFTQEQQLQIDADNPLCLDFAPRLELNGKPIPTSRGCAVFFNPCLPNGMVNELEAKRVLEHYGLDASYGWMIFRAAFPWAGKRRTEIKSLSLTMEPQPRRVPGPHFKVRAPGDSVTFCHPVSGTEYTLTVQELEPQTISENFAGSAGSGWVYPTHFTAMSYTLSPEAGNAVFICDCAAGDKPFKKASAPDRFLPQAQNAAACIGVIGGADGPTAIVCGNRASKDLHAACSSLHFEPVSGDIEWRVEFQLTQFSKETFLLV